MHRGCSWLQGGLLGFGAKYGKGFFSCRTATDWSAAVRLEGGIFGLQIGGIESDVVMLVMKRSGAPPVC